MKDLIIEKYGIKLIQLTIDKIELVRNWRNDINIKSHMEYQDFISPEMQLNWFNSINNNENFYFLIKIDDEFVGLVNVKDINFVHKYGESGIFIYSEKYLNSDLPVRANLCAFEFYFFELGLSILKGKINHTNKRAKRFSSFFGSKFTGQINTNGFELWETKKDDFEKQYPIIKRIITSTL
jgi:RimJ/RimL family protein N-acetyltransferase